MKIFKHLILGAIIFLTGINTVFASARMTVPVKERVSLEVQGQQTAVQIKWIILDHDQNIIKVSSGKYFGHVFETAGLYTVNVELTNTDTNSVSYTTVEILVGDSIQNFDQSTGGLSGLDRVIENSIKTSPPADANDVIHLPAQGGEVSFFVFPGDNLKSFSIDKDLSKDSDLDLDPSNDTDNLNSLLLQPYTVFYEAQAQPYKAKALALGLNNQTLTKTFTITFDGTTEVNQAPILILQSSPAADPNDQKIHLSGERADVSFDLSASTGNISEYRIDSNIFVDSDGNGIPDDDIDNLNDLSLHKGTPFTINYVKNSQKIIAQLTVLDKNGKGSRIQKEILFTTEVPFKPDFSTREPILYANQIIHFQNQTANPKALDLNYGWDFNSDKKIEIVSKEQIVEYTFPEPGKYPVTLYVRDPDGNIAQIAKTFLVSAVGLSELPEDLLPGEGRIQATIADFDLQISNFTVQFSDLSQVSPDLIDGTLQYQWSFGDNQTSLEQNPIHEYESEGTYIVELKITDTAQNIARKRLEIHVPSLGNVVVGTATGSEIVPPILTGDETGSGTGITPPIDQISPTGDSMFWWIVKIITWILLGIIILILLILGGSVLYIKMQHPDFSLLDAWEELKELINEKLQGTRAIPMDKKPNQPTAQAQPAKILAPAKIIEAKESGKTPAWLKTETTSSNQPEKKDSTPEKKKPESPKLSSDEIPDWLKPKPTPKEHKEISDDDDWLLKDDEDFNVEGTPPKSPETPLKPEPPKTPKALENEKKPSPPVKSEIPKETKIAEPAKTPTENKAVPQTSTSPSSPAKEVSNSKQKPPVTNNQAPKPPTPPVRSPQPTEKVNTSTPGPNKPAEKPEPPQPVVPNSAQPNTPPPVRAMPKPEAMKAPPNTPQNSPAQTPPPTNKAPQPSPKPLLTPTPPRPPEAKPKEESRPPTQPTPEPPLTPPIPNRETPKPPSSSEPEYLDIPKAEE